MRLTLRTMLAYLDDILEPEDADDLNKKISESDFASSLVHRTRDCVRRVRLGTPAIEGKGLAADGNTVAEYLDNTLEAERVPEFEKACLESDVHLAEVASCHQILTLVLGEPANVDGIRRDRLYETIARSDKLVAEPIPADQARPQPAHRTPAPSDTPDGNIGRRNRPEVPDYLRESAKARRWPLVATILATAAVVFLILMFFGPPDLRQQVASWMGRGVEPTPPLEESNAAAEENSRAPIGPESDGEGSPSPPPVDNEPANPTATTPPAEIMLPRTNPAEPDTDIPEVPSIPAPSPEDPAIEDRPDEAAIPAPSDTPAEDPTETVVDTAESPPGNPLRAEPTAPFDIAAGVGAEIGRFLGDTEVAVHFNRDMGTWRRLPRETVIAAGDRVLTLPSFRPAFVLTNGTTIRAAGPTSLTFEGLDEKAVPALAIEYGRLGMLTVGKAGNQVHLRFGQRDVMVTFGDAKSTLALEVVGLLPPGTDPEAGPPELAVDLYAVSGQIHVGEAGKETTIQAPEHITFTAQSASNLPAGQLPDWATREVINPLDERAATAFEKELTVDRPLSLAIKELSQNRRAEVRSLAIRCGGYVGEFEAYVSALNDADQRASWPAQIDSLKAALARGPHTAALVRETLEQQRGPDAKVLYRMLWGYTDEQFKNGEAEKLVDNLNHDSLDIRVLSFSNLQNITGMSLFYRPEYAAAKRKASFAKWREKLNEGKLVPQAPLAPGKA